MPRKTAKTTKYNKSYTRRYRRRRYSKKSYKFNKIPRGITPTAQYCTMKFASRLNFPALTSGVVGFQYINVGSIFDPLGAGGTRKFYGCDQMFLMYKYCTVMTCKVKLECQSPQTTTNPIIVMMTISDTSNPDPTINDISDFYENPTRMGSKPKMFGDSQTKTLAGNNYISGLYQAKKLFGKKFDPTDADYACTSTSNPQKFGIMGIYSIPPDATTSSAVNFMMTLSAIVRWWMPIGLANN